MKFKSCLTCKWFEGERTLYNTEETVLLKQPICTHEKSEGKTTGEMVYNGVCGRSKVLWERKEKKYSELEIMETD